MQTIGKEIFGSQSSVLGREMYGVLPSILMR